MALAGVVACIRRAQVACRRLIPCEGFAHPIWREALTEQAPDTTALAPATGRSGFKAGVRRARLPDPLLSVVAVALYVGLEWLSFLHEHDGLPVTPWNPGLGLMLALIVLGGPVYALVLFAGVVLAELLVLRSALPLHIDLAVGAIVAAAYGGVAVALRDHLRLDRRIMSTRDILVLLAGGIAGAVVNAALLSLLLLSVAHYGLADIARIAAPLVLGDVIGIVVVTPLLIRAFLQRERLGSLTPAHAAELAGFTIAVLLLIVITLRPGQPQQSLFYLLFLPVVVAAVRHGIDGACTALAIVQLVLVGALHFQGFELSRFTEYQMLMLVLTLTGLVVGSLVSERQLADENARIAAARLQQMQAEAARTARLNLVSGMAAALAHEVNQPMTAARALARSVQQLLRMPDGDVARAEANVNTMIEQIDHAGSIVRRMREFLRRGEPHISTLDIRVVLEEARALVQPLADARRIRIRIVLPGQAPAVFADRVQIQQVVINLIRNAIEAISDCRRTDGMITITVTPIEARKEIEIAVLDNGTGIEAERIPSLFEPLSTTRPEGIGLGLSICRTIIQAHGGRIWLSSSMPGRTEFRFTLPAGSIAGTKA